MYQNQNLSKRIIGLILIILLVCMPLTLAQVDKKEVGKEETGGLLSATIPEDNFLEGQLTDVNIIVNRYFVRNINIKDYNVFKI